MSEAHMQKYDMSDVRKDAPETETPPASPPPQQGKKEKKGKKKK